MQESFETWYLSENDLMQIDVFVCDVKQIDNAKRADILNGLSEYRKSKCLRFRTDEAQNLSLGAGYLLKNALAKYGINEMYVEYGFSENGKPYILNFPGIEFNISHSGSRVLCVSSGDGLTLGCDIEKIRSGKIKVAERFFTKHENEVLSNLKTDEEKDEMFSRLWTLKESFIKCTGEGLGRAMDSFEFYDIDGEYKVRIKKENSFTEDDDYGFICLNEISPLGDIHDPYKYSVCYQKTYLKSEKPVCNIYKYHL